jgi:hypothetical protein
MTREEQRGMIQELRDHTRRMTRAEEEEFSMFSKRERDDEDLDSISRDRLTALYRKFIPRGRYLL